MFTPFDDSAEPAQTPFEPGAGPPLGLAPLAGDHVADLAIVGGGITGCSAALHAAEAGARVVLVEARTIGWGASSRNAGHLPAATKHEPEQIVRRYGPVHGARILEASETGPRMVADLAARHSIDCDVELTGIITAAHSPAALEKLKRRAGYWQERGRPVEVLDEGRVAAMVGSELYLGGVIDRRGGAINPLAYVRGLARAAIRAGAALHEATPATGLAREGSGWRLTTEAGQVRAGCVLLCTNAHTDDLWPGLRQTIVPVRTVQFTTAPLPEAQRRTILPGRQPMIDTRRTLISVRLHRDGRLHFGGSAVMRPGHFPPWPAMQARIADLYPALRAVALEGQWGGWMAFNRIDSWQIHTLAPGLFTALGCNGRGVALATLYGRDLARHAGGTPADELTLPMSTPQRYPMHAVWGLAAEAIVKWYRLRDAIEMRRLRASRRDRGRPPALA